MSKMAGDLRPERLIEAREEKKLSQSALARIIGISPQAVQAMEAGRVKRTKYIRELAAAVGKPTDWLIVEGNNLSLQETQSVRYASFRGVVAAGLWQEDSRQVGDTVSVPASPDSRYSHLPQIAYRIMGDSMDRLVRDGEFVICIDYASHPVNLRDGDVIVAERKRGGEVERTIKRVRVRRGIVELWPESNNPKHQKPLILKAREEDTTVQVVGLVVGYYRSA